MKYLISEILKPAAHRLGTTLGTALATAGMAAGDVETVVAATTVAMGFVVDLIVRKALR